MSSSATHVINDMLLLTTLRIHQGRCVCTVDTTVLCKTGLINIQVNIKVKWSKFTTSMLEIHPWLQQCKIYSYPSSLVELSRHHRK